MGRANILVGWIDFFGTSVHTNGDTGQFKIACIQLNAITAFALFSTSVDLQRADTFWHSSLAGDSAPLGNIFGGTWEILAHGDFHHSVLFSYESHSLSVLYDEYQRCDTEPVMDNYTVNHPVVKNVGVGLVAKTSTNGLGPALSPLSHVSDPSVGSRADDKWRNIPIGNISTPITCSRRIVSMGGRRLWKRRLVDGAFTWDSWCAIYLLVVFGNV